MRRVTRLVAAACLVPATVVLTAPPVSARVEDCAAGRVCVYGLENFHGERTDYGRTQMNDTCFPIMYRSMRNETADRDVWVYPRDDCDDRWGVTIVQPGNELVVGDHRSLRIGQRP